jgi:hypothetical protein
MDELLSSPQDRGNPQHCAKRVSRAPRALRAAIRHGRRFRPKLPLVLLELASALGTTLAPSQLVRLVLCGFLTWRLLWRVFMALAMILIAAGRTRWLRRDYIYTDRSLLAFGGGDNSPPAWELVRPPNATRVWTGPRPESSNPPPRPLPMMPDQPAPEPEPIAPIAPSTPPGSPPKFVIRRSAA